MNVNEMEENLYKAIEQMVECVSAYGPGETLKLLPTYSIESAILRKLLVKFPSVVSTSLFLSSKPIIKVQVDQQAIERFSESNFPVCTREQTEEEDRTIPRKAPKGSKKTRCRKQKIR